MNDERQRWRVAPERFGTRPGESMRQVRETAPDKAPLTKSRSRRWLGRLSFAARAVAAAFAMVLLVPGVASASPPPALWWAPSP